jgi:hypothetical protein
MRTPLSIGGFGLLEPAPGRQLALDTAVPTKGDAQRAPVRPSDSWSDLRSEAKAMVILGLCLRLGSRSQNLDVTIKQ